MNQSSASSRPFTLAISSFHSELKVDKLNFKFKLKIKNYTLKMTAVGPLTSKSLGFFFHRPKKNAERIFLAKWAARLMAPLAME